MSAPRRQARRTDFAELRTRAIQLGNEWLCHALSTEPADRDAAENAITSVYALINEPPPSFVWVRSPQEAARILPPAPPPAPAVPPWSLESRIATVIHETRESMARRVPIPHRYRPREPNGDPLTTFTDAYVYERLNTIVRESVADVLRNELAMRLGLYWYGQQEADWIAHFDVQHRLGTVHLVPVPELILVGRVAAGKQGTPGRSEMSKSPLHQEFRCYLAPPCPVPPHRR